MVQELERQKIVLNHLVKYQQEENTLRDGVLEYQREIVSRSVDRENALLLKKITALYILYINIIFFIEKP